MTQVTQHHEEARFDTTARVARAVRSPVRRSDISFWAAVITGTSKKYGLEQSFLPKAYPAVYTKRPPALLDFSSVEVGEIVRHKGAGSRNRNEEEFWLILNISDEAVQYRLLRPDEVAKLYRGERPADAKIYTEE